MFDLNHEFKKIQETRSTENTPKQQKQVKQCNAADKQATGIYIVCSTATDFIVSQ